MQDNNTVLTTAQTDSGGNFETGTNGVQSDEQDQNLISQQEQNLSEVQENEAFTSQPEDKPFRLMVKFNHKELELDEENAKLLAQKGLNYDKVKAQLDDLMSTKVDDSQENSENEDGPQNELMDFFQKYPAVNAVDIPEAVIEAYSQGIPITIAYENFMQKSEIERLTNELNELKTLHSVERTNAQNKETATGSVSSFGNVNIDDIYTEEELNSLSKGELSGNLDKALKSMTFWSKMKINN